MQRTRFGVEEELTLQGLPPHYRHQCLNFVKYKIFQRLALFKNRDGAFLRTILRSLDKDYFAPGQIVLAIGDLEEMFVLATGEIHITDSDNVTVGRLMPGSAHAERALFSRSAVSGLKLVAETNCEVWVLRHEAFKSALKKHFSRLRLASIIASSTSNLDQTDNRVSSMSSEVSRVARTFQSQQRGGGGGNSKLVRQLSTDLGNGSSPGATGKSTGAKHQWRQPHSHFQQSWKHIKCALLIFQLYEVPYYIAFQRGFGLFNAPDSPNLGAIPVFFQQLSFFVVLLVELFFYVDWFFRARWFYRFAVGNSKMNEPAENRPSAGLLKNASVIFRHYRENDNVWEDVLLHLPLPLVWDLLPKHLFSKIVLSIGRFIRLLRLLRLRRFHAFLRSLMIENAFSPSKRMLVYAVIFCTSSAHIAACIFFLVGDHASYQGGLPVGGVMPDSMSTFDCLRDASLFRNCTWYVYDRATYNIDAPFLRSLQWSIVLQSTVGYGDIMSFSTWECVVGCLWIFLGANICYCTGCVLSSILGQLNILHTIGRDRMEEINLALMSATNLSESTKVMIRSYYDTKWQFNGSAAQDTEVLRHLPRSIRQQMRVALHGHDLNKCYLFASEPSGSSTPSLFIRELARIARSEIFLKDVMVVREGHLATEFYVLQSGEAELLLPPLVPSVELSSGFRVNNTGAGGARKSIAHAYRNLGQRLAKRKLVDPDASFGLDGSMVALSRLDASQSVDATNTFSRTNALYSRVMKLSQLDLRLSKLRQRSVVGRQLPCGSGMIPISILKQHDCFGEESLTPPGDARNYQVNVRVVASAQVAVICRCDLFAVFKRFPIEFNRIFTLLQAKADQDEVLLQALKDNFMNKAKIAKRLGIPQSLYVDSTKMASTMNRQAHWWSRFFRVLDPDEPIARWWYRLVGGILVYNFYFVIFRVAILPIPSDSVMLILTTIDYVFDFVLYVDIIIKYGWLGYVEHGRKIMDPPSIRARYARRWLKQDCWSMLPLFFQSDSITMTASRLPRILRSPQLVLIMDDFQTQIQERFLRGNNTKLLGVFDLFRFVLIFVSTAHYVGCLYYLLGRMQLKFGIADRSWINVDFILQQHPHSAAVHYMRSLYWSLSTVSLCFH